MSRDEDESPLDSTFDALVSKYLQEWHVPGMAVAVLNGNKTYAKGYGTAVYPNKKVTPETVFYAASTTKSFASAAVSLLIDDDASSTSKSASGAQPLSWATPLATLIPFDFVVPDSYGTSHITLEDALSHRTGMPDHEKAFGPQHVGVGEAVRSLRNLPMTSEIRTKFMYNNLMYTAISHVLETLSGQNLGDFLRERIWEPLKMKQTFWTKQEVLKAENDGHVQLARGYAWDDTTGHFKSEELPDFPCVSGSGAIISNVVDYAKWLRCMMTQSKPLSPAGHKALVEPRIVYTAAGNNPYPAPHLYALGWFIDSYQGERIIWHSGGWTGFGSVMAFLPDKQWGFAMMGNTSRTSNYVQMILFFRLLDDFLDVPESKRSDWNKAWKERVAARRTEIAEAREKLYSITPLPKLPSSLHLEDYAGSYSHPAYRTMRIEVSGLDLIADRSDQEISMKIKMEHVSGEFWLATLEVLNRDIRDCEVVRAEFRISASGEAESFGIDLEPAMKGEKIWFARIG